MADLTLPDIKHITNLNGTNFQQYRYWIVNGLELTGLLEVLQR